MTWECRKIMDLPNLPVSCTVHTLSVARARKRALSRSLGLTHTHIKYIYECVSIHGATLVPFVCMCTQYVCMCTLVDRSTD